MNIKEIALRIAEKDERIAELETYLKSETKDKESAQESFGTVWSKWQRCEKRIAQLEKQRDELLADLAEVKRSAEFNFEQYQDVGRLLHEECEKTEKLLASLERFATWARCQHRAQSKGCHATFDMMMLRDEIDFAEAAIARAKGEQE